jgi:23S rRNA-/tRNA-specific pseudouridylate synthase
MASFGANAPLGPGVAVVQQVAPGLVALAKPAGVLSHPNERGDEKRALLNCAYELAGEHYHWANAEGQPQRAWLLNRLDSGTSGVVLLATDLELAKHIRHLFKTKRIQKVYAALVFGRPGRRREVWRDRLAVTKQGGRIRTTGGQGNIPAEANMQWVDEAHGHQPPLSLIQLEPRTGRSHQLRVQCAQRHLPIVGDATYGDFRLNREFARRQGDKRLFLHSFRTAFEFDWQGKSVRFKAEAPLPDAFVAALKAR